MPPGSIGLLILMGLLLLRWQRRLGLSLIGVALFVGYLLSTKVVAMALIGVVQPYPALTPDVIAQQEGQAIVVLSSGRYSDAPEYGGVDTVGDHTLVRLRYGARLHHQTGLPVLVSGGTPTREGLVSLARLMADSLREDFGVNEIWLEEQSRTTAENAFLSREILARRGVERVYLVTEAWHMPRSVAIFESTGLAVIPAPTRFVAFGQSGPRWLDWLPSARGMVISRAALHELLGLVWYRLRH